MSTNLIKHVVDLDTSVTPGNRTIVIPPTLRCRPYEFDGTTKYSAVSATVSIDYDRTDPATGLPMAKITIPAGDTAYHNIDYYDMAVPWYMGPDDVWLISNYTTLKSADLQIQLLYSDDASISGADYRLYSFTGTGLIQTGYNILSMLQHEVALGGTEYGKVGTTSNNAWQDNNGKNPGTKVRSIRLRVKLVNASATPTEIFLGSIYTAPAGWAKSIRHVDGGCCTEFIRGHRWTHHRKLWLEILFGCRHELCKCPQWYIPTDGPGTRCTP